MGLLRQETQLFAALWLGTVNDMVPEAGDAREVSDRLLEAADAITNLPCSSPSYRQAIATAIEDEAPLAYHSSCVH